MPALTPAISPSVIPRTAQLLATGGRVRIASFGDSITGVYYHTGGRRAWGDVLGLALRRIYPRTPIEIIHAGISGNTTVDALVRMETDVLAHGPDLIVAMFGMNDVVRVSPDDYRAHLQEIIRRGRSRGAELVLMTPNAVDPDDLERPPAKISAYAQIVRELAAENQVLLADAYSAFEAIRTGDPHEWMRLMSDSVHPNMRGHVLFARVAAEAISGCEIPSIALPPLSPTLPHLQSLLKSGALARITAMSPFDHPVETAIRALHPHAQLEITTWNPSGRTIAEQEQLAKQHGWHHYRERPDLPKPDLAIVAVPADTPGERDKKFYRSYGWVLNWSQSFGNNPRTDCLALLPSVLNPQLTDSEAEKFARNVILNCDLPFLQRLPGDTSSVQELLTRELAALLNGQT